MKNFKFKIWKTLVIFFPLDVTVKMINVEGSCHNWRYKYHFNTLFVTVETSLMLVNVNVDTGMAMIWQCKVDWCSAADCSLVLSTDMAGAQLEPVLATDSGSDTLTPPPTWHSPAPGHTWSPACHSGLATHIISLHNIMKSLSVLVTIMSWSEKAGPDTQSSTLDTNHQDKYWHNNVPPHLHVKHS